jgi:hypothetical protein
MMVVRCFLMKQACHAIPRNEDSCACCAVDADHHGVLTASGLNSGTDFRSQTARLQEFKLNWVTGATRTRIEVSPRSFATKLTRRTLHP